MIGLVQDNWEWKLIELAPDAPQPSPRDFPGMVALPGDRLLVFGGLDAAAKRLDETWIFDCARSAFPHPSLTSSHPCERRI